MPKILFIFAAIVGATLLGSGPSAAVEGRYCAVVFNGEGAVKEICHFNSFEACRLEVTGGNRGSASSAGIEAAVNALLRRRRAGLLTSAATRRQWRPTCQESHQESHQESR